MFMWQDISNRSIITVRELNKNFPYLNLKKKKNSIPGFCFQAADWQGLAFRSTLLTLTDKTILLSFFNIWFFSLFSFLSKQHISDLFFLNTFSLIFTFYNVLSSFF